MPIYEYKCTTCDFSFEQKQDFDAETICSCPKCHNEARRQFRPAPIIFKGSGFYVTDYPSRSSSTITNNSNGDKEAKPAEPAGTTSSKNESSTSTKE